MSDLPNDVHMAIGELLGTSRLTMGRVDELRREQRELRQEVMSANKGLDERLVVVEKFMWKAMGIAVAASVIIPIVVTAVGYYLTGVF